MERGCLVVVLLLLFLALRSSPASHCNTSRDLAAPYATATSSKPRRFSDSNSCLLLFYPYYLSILLSNLALAAAAAFLKSLVALASTRPTQKIYVKRHTELPSKPTSLCIMSLMNPYHFNGSSRLLFSGSSGCDICNLTGYNMCTVLRYCIYRMFLTTK